MNFSKMDIMIGVLTALTVIDLTIFIFVLWK